MSTETQRALAEYKAEVDAKYAGMQKRHEAALAAEKAEKELRSAKDDWLLVNPEGRIDGVCARWAHPSATEAFELFFPQKRERLKAASEGWHIEQDDVNGTRFEEYAASFKQVAK